jgi:hypothetical protein
MQPPALAVEDVLAVRLRLPGMGVEALDDDAAEGRFLAQPDRRPEDEDVRVPHLRPDDLRPVVDRSAGLAHVRLHADGDPVIGGAQIVDAHTVLLHDRDRIPHQPLGVRRPLRRRLERAVDEDRLEARELVFRHACFLLSALPPLRRADRPPFPQETDDEPDDGKAEATNKPAPSGGRRVKAGTRERRVWRRSLLPRTPAPSPVMPSPGTVRGRSACGGFRRCRRRSRGAWHGLPRRRWCNAV